MSLDDQLLEILSQLGVVLEHPEGAEDEASETEANTEATRRASSTPAADQGHDRQHVTTHEHELTGDLAASVAAAAEISLFQASREHYGVFYRLDLAAGVPQLRVFLPDDEGLLKMRCYFVRATVGSPLHTWFLTDRAHDGSAAYEDAREAGQQHLLFAAGELMKRLFWTGDLDHMRFPGEIEVIRLA